MVNIGQRTVPLREKRLDTLTAWYGSIGSLVREAEESGLVQRVRTFAQDAVSDVILGLELLSTLRGIAIVVHGPAGCAAVLHQNDTPGLHWASTNINERDSILGGGDKLLSTLRQVYADHHSQAIVIVSTPVVIINNDDIDSVMHELRDDVGITLIPVFLDGFRSKVAATGYDAVSHALLKALPARQCVPTGLSVNLLSVSDSAVNILSLQKLLAGLAITGRPFPRFFDWQEAGAIATAQLSVTLDGGDADYAGLTLQKNIKQPYLNPPAPIGIVATTHWLTAITDRLGLSHEADLFIYEQLQPVNAALLDAAPLRGRRVFIHLSAGRAISFWHLARELGMEVVGLKIPFLDSGHVAALKEIALSQDGLPILVGAGQAFEEISLLKAARPDLYISQAIDALPAARLGIAILPLDKQLYLGFAGVINLLKQIKRRLAHAQFQQFLAEGDNAPYSDSWLSRSAYWHIKHEVR